MERKILESTAGQRRIGPGLLVAAAFIGPGTVFTASRAGSTHGVELLWTIPFAVAGAVVLQLLAARLGILAQTGLGEHLASWLRGSRWLLPTVGLVIVAIGLGNAFYQAGNLSGAVFAVMPFFAISSRAWILAMSLLSASLLLSGSYRLLQSALIALVALLSVTFLVTSVFALPSWQDIAYGMIPKISSESLGLVVALIGTTIVPYNLFLHAATASLTWRDVPAEKALREATWDTGLSISLGGLVTAAIMLTSSAAFYGREETLGGASEIATQLQPALGKLSTIAFAVGLFAAGLTSSITAPLATGYAVCGVLGWSTDPRSPAFRSIAIGVVAIATIFLLTAGGAPAETIFVAQLANGILLPIIAAIVLLAAKRERRVKLSQRLFAISGFVVTCVTALAVWKIFSLCKQLLE